MFINSLFLNVVENHIEIAFWAWLSPHIKQYLLGGSNNALYNLLGPRTLKFS